MMMEIGPETRPNQEFSTISSIGGWPGLVNWPEGVGAPGLIRGGGRNILFDSGYHRDTVSCRIIGPHAQAAP